MTLVEGVAEGPRGTTALLPARVIAAALGQFPPTEEQREIISFVQSSTENVLIEALAGAAKTSTLELIAAALPGKPILCVAFNKKIAEEMAKRLPGHCVAKTMNSIGHTAWGQSCGKRLTLDRSKMGTILKDLDLSYPRLDPARRRELAALRRQLAK